MGTNSQANAHSDGQRSVRRDAAELNPYAPNHPRYGHMGQAERAWTMRQDGLALAGPDPFDADEHEAGLVRGHHFVTWSEEVRRLKREARYDEALTLLLEIIDATESEQAVARSHAEAKAESFGVPVPVHEPRETPPGWTQHAAIIYRKLDDLESEIAIIDRWEAHAGPRNRWVGATHEKLLRRRETAQAILRQRQK